MNSLLNALIQKGHAKARNFHASPNKLGYAHVLTPKGIAAKARPTSTFLQRKRIEYAAPKAEAGLAPERGT